MINNSQYWQHKVSIYLHDPPHKAFDIKGHEDNSKEIANAVGVSIETKELYANADQIAAGLTRAALPGHDSDAQKNGAVNFLESPVITHPLVAGCLRLPFPSTVSSQTVHSQLMHLLSDDHDRVCEGIDDPEQRAKRTLFYLHSAARKRLRAENAGGLGGGWDHLPADTRMPDHSIWHHLSLASAIGSSLREDGNGNVSLAVFSITPVQPFIAKARKLRDHWFASVILSYLAFVGIRHVAETLGPDHVVYPSLQDQSLYEAWAGKMFGIEEMLKEPDPVVARILNDGSGIASFPNKFVFIAPGRIVEDLCTGIRQTVNDEWVRIAGIVRDFLASGDAFRTMFDRQVADYWQYSFASCRIPRLDDTGVLGEILHETKWKNEHETLTEFASSIGATGRCTARLYATAHTLIQSVLAAAKMRPTRIRASQHGEKCPLCGEHEVLHDMSAPQTGKASDYKKGIKEFWDNLRKRFNSEGSFSEVGEAERLCAVCSVKRFLPRALRQERLTGEILYQVAGESEGFPSTTSIAAASYIEALEREGVLPPEKRFRFIDALHESSKEEGLDDQAPDDLKEIKKKGVEKKIRLTNRDKYYALLLMDGDKMGDLINGESLTATWGDVIHPELRKRFDRPDFMPKNRVLGDLLGTKRTLNPALHAAISDSLNSFARLAVAPIVARNGGRLIYAGGDDVCAIVPLDTALETADAIRKAYTMQFVRYIESGPVECGEVADLSGRIGVHLGKAKKISISAAIVIAHHKEPLRDVLHAAHGVLDGVAKEKGGRNAVAIRLMKRSGGDRDFVCKWDAPNPFRDGETILESFRAVSNEIGDALLSTSLIYRLKSLEDLLHPLRGRFDREGEKILRLFGYEIGHSKPFMDMKGPEKERKVRENAERLAGITLFPACSPTAPEKEGWFNPEAAVIAGFFGRKEQR